jgi:hypothetical protein
MLLIPMMDKIQKFEIHEWFVQWASALSE